MNFSTSANATISSNFRDDLRPPHPQDRAVQVDVLSAGQLRVEPGSHLQQAPDPAVDIDLALGRLGDPADRIFSSVLLPAPLRPMMPTTSPGCTSNDTSFRRPERRALLRTHSPRPRNALKGADASLLSRSRRVVYRSPRPTQPVLFAQTFDTDRQFAHCHHTTSAKVRSIRRK